MTRFKALSSVSAMTAALSMGAVPASAAGLPQAIGAPYGAVPIADTWQPDESVQHHRGYRYRRHRGIDAGDVLTGVLVIGGIAAIASAVSDKNDRRQRVDTTRYQDRPIARRSGEGIDNAVNMCLREIQRDVRVEGVDNVSRTGAGWNVAGTLYNGTAFTCTIGNNGRIDGISYGGQTAYAPTGPVQDRQYSDARYSAAWDRVDAQSAQVDLEPTGPQPAYPGGPLPGEEGYEDSRVGG
ncbi:hypothetical protein QWY75_02415 [Pontixanthobacter aestiaquae]|uniref:Secreted protein n=1 Tax=Pontixanthobacter aestiaquae TaxID=1509367 RepID=A0A844ZA70_9SPHN|nr:hypothetical protein [Pontixanthobacter aestiaquae]MDN3645057.1 hypothetical protein [Pontixanthobacter aestiaquae]MXO83943.1 hypothetical protein [Pontixanthobacter aestiaquae]